MLKTPSAFPEVGSWALLERDGIARAVRINWRPMAGGDAVVLLADVPTASGAITVPLGDLLDPTPLTTDERAEMERLGTHLTGLAHPEKSPKAVRFETLVSRGRRADQLVELLGKLEGRGIATPATREAKRFFEAAIAAGMLRRAA